VMIYHCEWWSQELGAIDNDNVGIRIGVKV